MYRLDMYPGASLLRTLYMNKPLLHSSCFYVGIEEQFPGVDVYDVP